MKRIIPFLAIILISSCNKHVEYDAQGTFEATEVTVSAETTGKILNFHVTEGENITTNNTICFIDSTQLHLQRKQLVAQRAALLNSLPDKDKQVASLRQQIATQKNESKRIERMLKNGAATQKQYDDINAQISILEDQLSAMISNLNNNTASINENIIAFDAQIEALNDQIQKCNITSPIDGTILVKYAEAGELATTGKPIVKIADLNNIYLRAYLTSEQLAQVNLGNEVTVTANFGGEERFNYTGKIVWISSENEFTPKTIQTQDSRANLVYAVKIAVVNDGRLKIGLAGDVTF